MSFGLNFGEEIKEGGDACDDCGEKSAQIVEFWEGTLNEKESFDRIRRCPSCGQSIQSFVAICPACGNELNTDKVSHVLNSFAVEVKRYEEEILKKGDLRSGCSAMTREGKMVWIAVNILLLGFPFSISMLLSLLRKRRKDELSGSEWQLASFIENYSVPNDRRSILELLVYIKEKLNFLAKEPVNKKTLYWMELWFAKGEQLKQKADLMFSDDPVARKSFLSISEDKKKMERAKKNRILLSIGMFCLSMFLLLFLKEVNHFGPVKNPFANIEIPDSKLGNLLPKFEGGRGKVKFHTDSYLDLELNGISKKQYEDYKKKCKEKGFTFVERNDDIIFNSYNKEGYNVRMLYNDGKLSVNVFDKKDLRKIKWPKNHFTELLPVPESDFGLIRTSDDSVFYAYIGNMTKEDFYHYTEACIEKGFDKDLHQSDGRFMAKNEEGYSLMIFYEGFQIISISLHMETK